jgi:predicted phage terminase large subunit-like protein
MLQVEQEQSLDKEMIEKLRERAKSSFYFFAKGVLGFDLLTPGVHLPVCQLFGDLVKKRKRVILPRGWLKTTIVLAYLMWRAIRDPNIRCLFVQNSHANACKKLAVIRGKFETCELLRVLFPELLPDKTCTWTTESLCLKRTVQNAEGTFECCGTRTKIVGRHYNVIVEDDTVAPDLDDMSSDALLPSKEDVEQAIGWHRGAMPFLVNPLEDEIIIVGTRWWERDLLSWNIEHEPSYVGYIRAVRETGGLADEDGDITYPERFSEPVLEELKAALGPYLFSCLYMNKPLRSKDMVFQPEWFQYYETPPRDLVCYTTVDLAGDPAESKSDPDYNVVITCGKCLKTGMLYVLEYMRERCNPSEVIHAIFDHVRKYQPVKVGIESIAYQKSMMYWIRERMRADNLYFFVEGVTHGKKSKNSRIAGLQPLVHSGMLRFRNHHRMLVTELTAFPLAAYDDIGDALSMQIPMWVVTRSAAEAKRPNPREQPLSFDQAEAEITKRNPDDPLQLSNPYVSVEQ